MDVNIGARASYGLRSSGLAARRSRRPQMSFTSAITIPAATKTTIAICIQIQLGDTSATRRAV
jgi:hypothetical protein